MQRQNYQHQLNIKTFSALLKANWYIQIKSERGILKLDEYPTRSVMIFTNTAIFAVMARQRRIIRIFHDAGAVKSFKAIVPEEHGISKNIIFNRLVRNGVLSAVHDGRYYLNENREKELRKRRKDIIGFILMVIAILVLIAVFWQVV